MHRAHLAVVAALFLCFAGCGSTTRSYGYRVIETRANDADVRASVYEAAHALAHEIWQADGTTIVPTWFENGHSISGVKGSSDVTWVKLSFADASGTNYTIDRLYRRGRPKLILLEASKEEAAMDLHNRIAAALSRREQ